MGRFRPVVTIPDSFVLATCYAELNGRVRPEAFADVTPLLKIDNQSLDDDSN